MPTKGVIITVLVVVVLLVSNVIVSILSYINTTTSQTIVDNGKLMESTWGRQLLDDWNIEFEDSVRQNILDNVMRSQLLHSTMGTHKRSTLSPSLPITIRAVKWTGIEIPQDHVRHRYNPSFSDVAVIFRNDNIFDLWQCDCFYEISTFVIDPISCLPFFGKPTKVEFIDTHGKPKPTAMNRYVSTKAFPVFEDLRFATMRTGSETAKLVTGVALNHTDLSTAFSVFEYVDDRLMYICSIESPIQSRIEKNWLFIQSSIDGRYQVLYDWYPTLIVFDYEKNTLCNKQIIHVAEPSEWCRYMDTFDNMSHYRMSAACFVKQNTELLLILHRKDMLTCLYVHFCIYLDSTTFEPVAFIPMPVMTDVAVRIFFPMSVTVDRKYVHISCGVNDEIGGVLSYDADAWDKLKRPFLKPTNAYS